MLVFSLILGVINLYLWQYPAIFYPCVICGLLFSKMAWDEKLLHDPIDVVAIALNALALVISVGNLVAGWIKIVGPKL